MTVLLLLVALSAPLDAKMVRKEGDLLYYDVRALGVEGQGWTDLAAPFDRLPARAEKIVRKEVWGLSRHSAGQAVRFRTKATSLSARWTLTSHRLGMVHMPPTGVSGLDLYVRDESGKWRWLSIGRPTAQTTTATLISGLPAGKEREFLLYLPLYNGVSSVEVGVPAAVGLSPAPPRPPERRKPIVFYGTSITHGACASRPGMTSSAILGRRLDRPIINLGFSGNGRMELELAQLLGEIDAAAYVIDCLPNITADLVAARTAPLVREIRKARPHTPILLVEDRSYGNAHALPAVAKRNADSRAALFKAYQELTWDGVVSLHYLEGPGQIGDDDEGTVDSSHPTDLGFMRQADAFEPKLRHVLGPGPQWSYPLGGYTDQLSYQAGDTIRFHVSCAAPTFDLTIVRAGKEADPDSPVVHREKGIKGKEHPVPGNASSHGCRWPETWSLKVPTTWRSGYYEVRLEARDAEGKPRSATLFFVVRSPRPGKDAKALLVLSTNTYNAYTNWGGYSLYAYHAKDRVQGRRVSFDRPITSQFRTWEAHFVRWAEANGHALDYAVNSDLELRPDLLRHYKLVVSVGHDEYWSAAMRDHLEAFIKAGGNVAFLSGNTCCWQVRTEDKGRALTCYKQAYRADPLYAKGDHKLLSTLWSHHLVARPENELTGVGFLHGGYHRSHGQLMKGRGAFTIHDPDHWVFEGTGLRRGDELGGANKIVGYECDGCELKWESGRPVPTFRDGTPRHFRVLATAPAKWHPDDCEWYEKWEKGRNGHAVIGTYTRGGTVITVGTTDWAHGLRGRDPAVMRITANILNKLSK